MKLTKLINEKHLIVEYKVYEYNIKNNQVVKEANPNKEIMRIQVLSNIAKKYPKLDIFDIMLNGYSLNKNNLDPVICTNLNKNLITNDKTRILINKYLLEGVKAVNKIYEDEDKIKKLYYKKKNCTII